MFTFTRRDSLIKGSEIAFQMNNSSLGEDLQLAQDEIDDLWRTINRSPSDPVAHWIFIFSFVFALLGSISNLMSVIVLLRLSTQLSTFVYLTGLSLSDMITCISIIFTHLVEYLVQTQRNTSVTIFLRHVEIVFGGLAAGSRVLSLWISTAVTMDRWILICYPIYGKSFCTLKRARVMTGLLFLFAFIYSVPLFFEYQIIEMPNVYQMVSEPGLTEKDPHQTSMLVTKGYSDLAKRRLYRWAYMFFNAIFVYSLPTLMIVSFNLQLIRALHRLKSRTKRLRQKNQVSSAAGKAPRRRHHRRSQQSKYSVTIMVIAMVLTLLLCRSPTIVLWVLWSFELTIKIFFDSSSSSVVRRFHTIANLIAIINAATNFLPFCVFGQLFRVECLTIYCCRKPNSEQLAQQARRKYEEKHQLPGKQPRDAQTPLTVPPSPVANEYLRTGTSANSDTTDGITSSHNHPSSIYPPATNVLRLSDPPVNPSDHHRFPSISTPLLKETIGL